MPRKALTLDVGALSGLPDPSTPKQFEASRDYAASLLWVPARLSLRHRSPRRELSRHIATGLISGIPHRMISQAITYATLNMPNTGT